jgi:hypothetical protein
VVGARPGADRGRAHGARGAGAVHPLWLAPWRPSPNPPSRPPRARGYGCGILPGVYASVPNLAAWASFAIDSAPSACGKAVPTFTRVGDANWVGKPAKSLRRPRSRSATGTAEEWCQQECLARQTPQASGKVTGTCVALSLSTRLRGGSPRCDLFFSMPPRVCGSGDRTGGCARASQGAFRLAFTVVAP